MRTADVGLTGLAALLLLGIASADPLALLRAQYASPPGGAIRLQLPSDSSAAVQHGRSLHTRTTPNLQHAPFATADREGNLVIAVPTLAAPGRYTVRFDLISDSRTLAAAVLVNVSAATQVPVGPGTPVILLNGWQAPSLTQLSTCPTSAPDGSTPFGTLPKLLPVFNTFFDNCVECPNCPIEMLGADLGQVINSLVYTDGTPVQQVDVVAHSMGGLIVRSYLAGKSQTSGVFAPPPNPKVRKAVFVGTPHFGSFLASDFGAQSASLSSASQFLWDLSRWNQGNDDLREVDALAIVGNASLDGKSDGVVSTSSASLDFAGYPDVRTRIIDACHVDGLLAYALLCSTNSGIASSTESQQIILGFLASSNAWMSVGHTPSQDSVLSRNGGRFMSVVNAANVPETNVSGMAFAGQALSRNSQNGTIFYNDFQPAGSGSLTFTVQGQSFQDSVAVTAGGYASLLLKSPPAMAKIQPAAAAIPTLNIAPGSLISIFGTGLASSTATSSFPWPTNLADVTLTANGQPLQLLYVGSNQINAYLPAPLSGLVSLQLTNPLGQHTLNVMTAAATPAIFSADGSGTGIAAAIHASTGLPVTATNPATAGEYLELYGTGFGATYESGGLAVTSLTPTLTVGGESAMVSFSGVPVGGVGLYQINFIVPAGLASGTSPALTVTMRNYTSNTVTLPVR